jgi:hypothetical protein
VSEWHSLIIKSIGGGVMKLVNDEGVIIESTERAYEVVYKNRGFKPYTPEIKKDEKKTSSASKKKKVKADDDKS